MTNYTYFISLWSRKNDASEIPARGFTMAIYGKIRIKEGNNRGFVHRPKQRIVMQSRKTFIV
jgi:hypothetical protein